MIIPLRGRSAAERRGQVVSKIVREASSEGEYPAPHGALNFFRERSPIAPNGVLGLKGVRSVCVGSRGQVQPESSG